MKKLSTKSRLTGCPCNVIICYKYKTKATTITKFGIYNKKVNMKFENKNGLDAHSFLPTSHIRTIKKKTNKLCFDGEYQRFYQVEYNILICF